MSGELWKVAREQAINVEKQGVEVVMNDCKELVEEYKQNLNRSGFKHFTNEVFPEEEEEALEGRMADEHERKRRFEQEETQEEGSGAVRRRLDEEIPAGIEKEEYIPTDPGEGLVNLQAQEEDAPGISRMPSAKASVEESDAEAEARNGPLSRKISEEGEYAKAMDPQELMKKYEESKEKADRFDDIPPYGNPARWRNNRRGPVRDPFGGGRRSRRS